MRGRNSWDRQERRIPFCRRCLSKFMTSGGWEWKSLKDSRRFDILVKPFYRWCLLASLEAIGRKTGCLGARLECREMITRLESEEKVLQFAPSRFFPFFTRGNFLETFSNLFWRGRKLDLAIHPRSCETSLITKIKFQLREKFLGKGRSNN